MKGRGVAIGGFANSFPAIIADITVNKKTGKITVDHLYAAQDAGTTVNPASVENQMVGCLVHGTSRALIEEVSFSKVRTTSLDWVTYPSLRFKESPKVTTVVVQRLDLPSLGLGRADDRGRPCRDRERVLRRHRRSALPLPDDPRVRAGRARCVADQVSEGGGRQRSPAPSFVRSADDDRPRRAARRDRALDIDFHYPNGHQAIGGLSITVRRGEIVGVIGPSGCGKSTLLQVIAGLNAPSHGTVMVEPGPAGRPPLAEVFQKDTLLPWLRVRDNVALYFKFHHIDRRAMAARVDELLGMVGLEQFADAYPYQLSGGMKRRIAFLAGVAPDPQLLLLDEPFSSVDEPSRVDIHQQVPEVLRQRKTTTILVTHDLAEAVTLSDRVVILSAGPGRVVADHPVPFGDERDVLALRNETAFLELYGKLWEELSAQIEVARGRGNGREAATT